MYAISAVVTDKVVIERRLIVDHYLYIMTIAAGESGRTKHKYLLI